MGPAGSADLSLDVFIHSVMEKEKSQMEHAALGMDYFKPLMPISEPTTPCLLLSQRPSRLLLENLQP